MSKHWTDDHIKQNGERFTAFDEAGMVHGVYETHDEARDALVVYSALCLSDEGKRLRTEERKKGAADFKAELHNASSLPVRIHAEGFPSVDAQTRRQR